LPDGLARFERWLLDHPRSVLLFGLIVVLAFGLGLTRARFANDYRIFFDAADPQRVAHEVNEDTFAPSDSINIVLIARNGDLFRADRLAVIAEATAAARRLPHVTRVDSLSNFQFSRAQGDELTVAPLVDTHAPLTPTAIAGIRANAMGEPALVGRLIARDGRTATIIASVRLPADDPRALAAVTDAAKVLRAKLAAQSPELDVRLTGVILLSQSFYDVTQSDLMRLAPVMVLLLFVAIWGFFRAVGPAFASMLVLGLACLLTMGFGGWMGIALSPASGQVPVIILTIATAECIHLIGCMRAAEMNGFTRRDALARSLAENRAPVALTTLTDILGFLCFNFSDTPPFRDLGNLAAFGAIAAYFCTMVILPAMLCVLPVRGNASLHETETPVEAVALWAVRWRWPVIGGFSLLAVALGVLIPRMPISDNFVQWLGPQQAFRQDAEVINQHLPGIYVNAWGVGSGEENGVADPDYLRRLDAFTTWLRAQPEVAHVLSLSDMMKRLNRNMNGDDPAAYTLPSQRDLAAQYLVLFEMSLQQDMDLGDVLSIDKSKSRVLVTLNDVPSHRMIAFQERANRWLHDNTPARMHAHGAGTTMMFAYLTENNNASMLKGTATAILIIALVTGLALRSARLGLICLVPATMPVVMAFGAWYCLVGSIGLYAAFVTSCAMGLTVDSTTHFVMKFHDGWVGQRMNPIEAIRHAFRRVGTELWIASAVLIAGFLVLTLSQFALIARLGAMTSLIFVFAIATTFLMTPALLCLLLGERSGGGQDLRQMTPAPEPGREAARQIAGANAQANAGEAPQSGAYHHRGHEQQ